jgi:hypothetical protein
VALLDGCNKIANAMESHGNKKTGMCAATTPNMKIQHGNDGI